MILYLSLVYLEVPTYIVGTRYIEIPKDYHDYRNYLTARHGPLTGGKKHYRREITVISG